VTEDDRLAGELAAAAGDLLLAMRSEIGFADPTALRKSGDRSSHDLLVRLLAERRPGDCVLSEEGTDDAARLSANRVWIVDPLDGTREYGEEGRADWAVHVALWADGDLVAGAVALPAAGRVLATGGDLPDRAATSGAPRVVVSRTRAPEWVSGLATDLGAELLPMGSAGAKIAAVVTGDADVYVHAGGQYEWDSAAPVAVARTAGLHCSRIDGSPLRYNRPDPLLPDLVVCRADLASRVLGRLAAASG
jgi:3'(2'), 5'-bisphosphate nucleotidase